MKKISRTAAFAQMLRALEEYSAELLEVVEALERRDAARASAPASASEE